jgi:hypothetical protein
LLVPANAVTFGTSGTFSVESLHQNLDVKQYNNQYWLVPKKDKNGVMYFKIVGNAANGTTAHTTKTLSVKPMTDVVLQIVDNDVDSVTLPAYIKIGTDSMFSPNATFALQFPGGQTKTVVAGMTRKDNPQIPWSYKRIFDIVTPANGNDLDTIIHAAVSYYLRDMQGAIKDSFYIAGFSPISDSSKMTPQRFKTFLDWCHFSAGYNGINGGIGGIFDETINRYSGSANGFTPDSIVLYLQSVDTLGGVWLVSNMEQSVINRINVLYNQWIVPLLGGRHPPIKYHQGPYIRGPLVPGQNYNYWVNVSSFGDEQTPYGYAGQQGTPPSTVVHGRIGIRSGGPNYFAPPEPILTTTILQEFGNILVYHSARGPPIGVARPEETIIHDGTALTIFTWYDIKAGRIVQETRFITGTHIDKILGN